MFALYITINLCINIYNKKKEIQYILIQHIAFFAETGSHRPYAAAIQALAGE